MTTGFTDNGGQMISVDLRTSIGDGRSRSIGTAEGTTVRKFYDEEIGDPNTKKYVILVNGREVAGTHVLVDGDMVSVTPTKVTAA